MARKNRKNKNEVLDKALGRYKASWDYASGRYHNLWGECWRLRENQRVKRSHEGVVKTFVPMTFSLVETITCALFNNRPKISFAPNEPSQEQNTQVLTALINQNWERDKWGKKFKSNGRATYTVGNGAVMLTWDIDHVRVDVIPIRDFIMDPSSTGPEDWEFAGRRYLTTKKKLESYEIVDVDTGEMKPRYKNLNDVPDRGSATEGEDTDKQSKDSLLGSTMTEETDQIEIIEIWDRDRVVSIANRSIVIEDIENPLKTQAVERGMEDEPGIIPFALSRGYIDSSLPYGKGDVEVIMEQQELLNDFTEINLEAVLHQLYPARTLDPNLAPGWIDRMDPVPGAVYPFPANALNQLPAPIIPANAFNERANIKSEIREATAVDQVVKGVTSATTQTATEIRAQLGQASQRIESKARDLEDDFFPQVAIIWFNYYKLYAREQFVRVASAEGEQYLLYDPAVFMGEYTPKIQLEVTKELERDKKRESLKEAYAMLIQDRSNNLLEIKRQLLPELLDLPQEAIERIITPAPEPPTPEAPPAPQDPMMPTDMPSMGAPMEMMQ